MTAAAAQIDRSRFAARHVTMAVAAGVAVATLVVLTWTADSTRHIDLSLRKPGLDRTARTSPQPTESPLAQAQLIRGDAAPSGLPGSWPGFRGANHNAIANTPTPIARTWPSTGPRVMWRLNVGEGYAGPAVHRGCVYLMDYDREKQADALRCLSLESGQEIWRYTYPISIKRNHGMSRTVPTVDDSVVVAMGPKCHVVCLDSATGEKRWDMDLVRNHQAVVPPWYAGQCPLLDDGKVILAPCGDALLMAVDAVSGKIVWQTPNTMGWSMTHASVIPVTISGRRTLVYCASGGVAGVAADTGELLWRTDAWQIRIATIASALPVDEDRLFMSGGYNGGSMFLKLVDQGDRIGVQTGLRLKPAVFGSTQQTPLFHDRHIFGVRPDGQMVCLDLKGVTQWESSSRHRFGLGPYMIVNDTLLAMDDDGLLTMAEATSHAFRILGQARVLEGHDAWAPMAFAERYLLLRDMTTLICIDLGEDTA